MNADGSDRHEYRPDPRAAWDGVPAVSPDGSLLAWWHGFNDGPADGHGITVARADGTGSLIDTGPKLLDPEGFVWAPDSSKILMCCDPDGGHALLLDPGGGPWATVPWQSDADIVWQRTVN
jgi:hypothetical protein